MRSYLSIAFISYARYLNLLSAHRDLWCMGQLVASGSSVIPLSKGRSRATW